MKCPYCSSENISKPKAVGVKTLVNTDDEFEFIKTTGLAPARWEDMYIPLNMYTCNDCKNVFFTALDLSVNPIFREPEDE
ncbi:hypothetical protein [Deferribacter abyssi]|uniref:hypothetical protein n=1 Tax=Deferribacter abyssi TaxID=213806 RepID=UPI003C160667